MKKIFGFLSIIGIFLAGPVLAVTYAQLDPTTCIGTATLSNGNLTMTVNNSAGWESCTANIGKSNGKWYWTVTIDSISAGNNWASGIWNFGTTGDSNGQTGAWGYAADGNGNIIDGAWAGTGTTFSVGDVIRYAFDADNKTLDVYQNASLISTITGIDGAVKYPWLQLYNNAGVSQSTFNFGSSTFAYPPPAGFNAGLCLENSCSTSTINFVETPGLAIFFERYHNAIIAIGSSFLFSGLLIGLYVGFIKPTNKKIKKHIYGRNQY